MITTEVAADEMFILELMTKGNKDAFRYFFDRYYADLCNFVNIYVHNEIFAEEIVQDIFVYFWERRENIRMTHSVKSYLFSASKNKSLNFLRDQRTRDAHHQKLIKEINTVDYTSQQYLVEKDLRALIHKAIDSLPAKCRSIYLLSRDQELTHKEIAAQLEISTKTVENQITIALKKIREFLKPYHEEIFIMFLYFLQ